MIHRKGVPDERCSSWCRLKEKLDRLWDRTIGSVIRINGITPDGDGDFRIEAGSNIALSETGTGNGIKIDTTGGVSYYTTDDPKLSIDNSDLKISTVGVALQEDLDTVAQATVDNAQDIGYIVDGTTKIGRAVSADNAATANSALQATDATNAVNAANIVSASTSIGDSTHPVYVQNGQAVAMSEAVVTTSGSAQQIDTDITFSQRIKVLNGRYPWLVMDNQNKAGLISTSEVIDRTANPSIDAEAIYAMRDINNNNIISIMMRYRTNGRREMLVRLWDRNGSSHDKILFAIDANGNTVT